MNVTNFHFWEIFAKPKTCMGKQNKVAEKMFLEKLTLFLATLG